MTGLEFRDVTGEAPSAVHFPDYVLGFEELGFQRLGRVASAVHGRAAPDPRAWPPQHRQSLTDHSRIPMSVLAAPDGSALVTVDWWWDMPEVRLRTELSSGAVVETRRRWDHEPVWAKSQTALIRGRDLARWQARGSARGRDIEVVAGGPPELWRRHRDRVAEARRRTGSEPVELREMSQALALSERIAVHDLAVDRRLGVIYLAYVATVATVAVAILISGLTAGPAGLLLALLLVAAFLWAIRLSRGAVSRRLLGPRLRPAYRRGVRASSPAGSSGRS